MNVFLGSLRHTEKPPPTSNKENRKPGFLPPLIRAPQYDGRVVPLLATRIRTLLGIRRLQSTHLLHECAWTFLQNQGERSTPVEGTEDLHRTGRPVRHRRQPTDLLDRYRPGDRLIGRTWIGARRPKTTGDVAVGTDLLASSVPFPHPLDGSLLRRVRGPRQFPSQVVEPGVGHQPSTLLLGHQQHR